MIAHLPNPKFVKYYGDARLEILSFFAELTKIPFRRDVLDNKFQNILLFS